MELPDAREKSRRRSSRSNKRRSKKELSRKVTHDHSGNSTLGTSIGELLDEWAVASGDECHLARDGFGDILLRNVSVGV